VSAEIQAIADELAARRGKIGHLRREDAEAYQNVLLAVERRGSHGGACSAFLQRASNGNWGVVLALSHPRICLDEMER
jgi:hypothetical protein